MSESFCPEEFWNYNYCNAIDINDKTLAGVKIKGKLVEELNNLYSTYLNKSAVHPSLLKISQQLDEEEEIEKEKERLKKEQEKAKNQKKPGEVEDTKRTLMNINKEEGGGETNEEEEVQEKVLKEIIFNSIRIDQNTIKFLFLMLPRTPIVSLKTSYNNLTLKNFNLLIDSLIHKPNNIYSFRFEWNDYLINEENNNQKMIFSEMNLDQPIPSEITFMKNLKLLFAPDTKDCKLEAISFRGCFLGNQLMNELLPLLKDNQNLLVLNLYKNNLSNDCLKNIGEMFLYNRKLQEINLGGNLFNDETIKYLKDYIGIYELDAEGYEKMLKLIEEKNQILEFNKKINKNSKPKISPKEVPFVDEIKDEAISEDEVKHYRVRNDTIQKIDFMNNPNMTQKSFEDLLYLVDNTNNLILYLDLRKYDKDSVLKMIDINGRYFDRIYLYK
jgi:hypothetical protein